MSLSINRVLVCSRIKDVATKIKEKLPTTIQVAEITKEELEK